MDFSDKSEGHLEAMTTALLALEKTGDRWDAEPKLRKQLFNELNLLKESAQEDGSKAFNKNLQLLEKALLPLKEESDAPLSEESYQALFEIIDLLTESLWLPANSPEQKEATAHIRDKIASLPRST